MNTFDIAPAFPLWMPLYITFLWGVSTSTTLFWVGSLNSEVTWTAGTPALDMLTPKLAHLRNNWRNASMNYQVYIWKCCSIKLTSCDRLASHRRHAHSCFNFRGDNQNSLIGRLQLDHYMTAIFSCLPPVVDLELRGYRLIFGRSVLSVQ